jgi:hypothetical protein
MERLRSATFNLERDQLYLLAASLFLKYQLALEHRSDSLDPRGGATGGSSIQFHVAASKYHLIVSSMQDEPSTHLARLLGFVRVPPRGALYFFVILLLHRVSGSIYV